MVKDTYVHESIVKKSKDPRQDDGIKVSTSENRKTTVNMKMNLDKRYDLKGELKIDI